MFDKKNLLKYLVIFSFLFATFFILRDYSPKKGLEDWVIGAVDNILNFDEININRATNFCDIVPDVYKNTCFWEIGKQVALQVITPQQAEDVCQQIKIIPNQQSCILGTKIKGAASFSPLNLGQEEEDLLIKDDNFLKKILRQSGPQQVVDKLAIEMPQQNLICHDRAHQVGRFSYELFGPQAFKLCSSQCHSGCYHGAAEAFFKDKGTANLDQNLSIICQDQSNRFFSHQCIHGVGHGLMAWSNYELYEALAICDDLDSLEAQTSCYTGVFMENIVGGLSVENAQANFSPSRHYTKYLNSNPHYPCNEVSDKYKGSCYFLQTSRMIQLFAGDFQKIAQSCLKAPTTYQKDCFQSMGRDVGGASKHNVKLAISRCQYAPFGLMRQECLSGAVQDTFWDPSGQKEALSFCQQLTDRKEVDRCYQAVAQRATELLGGTTLQSFCLNIPVNLQYLCQNQATYAQNVTQQQNFIPRIQQVLSAETDSEAVIEMSDRGFQPKQLTVKKGITVTFKNQDKDVHWPASNIHPTHSIYPEFDPQQPIKSQASWKFTFEKVGTWRFHDHLNPILTGTITVTEYSL